MTLPGVLEPLARAAFAYRNAWVLPPDTPAQGAALVGGLLGLLAVLPGGARWLALVDDAAAHATSRRRFVTLTGFAAAFLSLGYVMAYLGGAPRIIDATTYFLQGRALSHGFLSWPLPDVSASFRGRFLLVGDGTLGGLFPPGYPLLLALGFLVGAPMVVGPALAFALVACTHGLAREMAAAALEEDIRSARVEAVARCAACFSVVSAALRYHTADTMSHGAAAVGITFALSMVLRARRLGSEARGPLWSLAGLAIGYVLATRPVSAIPIAAIALALASRSHLRRRAVVSVLSSMVPGLLLLLASQHAVTGHLGTSTQYGYYALSDGPPGCFRYGLGRDIGCLVEHGEYVRDTMPEGYDLGTAALVTFRRLRSHTTDVLNLELLAYLPLLALRRGRRVPSVLAVCLAVVGGQVLAYAPFYFEGTYPGGGARFFADVLPVEHALAACVLADLGPRRSFGRRALATLALALGGFAFHGVLGHEQLRARDGGRPMFEIDAVHNAGLRDGLLFVDSDHAFGLAHDPATLPSGPVPGPRPTPAIVVARYRGDDHDRLLFETLGRPPAHRYIFTEAGPTLVPWTPTTSAISSIQYQFEAEADWPPLQQMGGWAVPRWATGSCASGGRGLAVVPAHKDLTAAVWWELPVPKPGTWLVTPSALRLGSGGKATLSVYSGQIGRSLEDALDDGMDRGPPLGTWEWADGEGTPYAAPRCETQEARRLPLVPPRAWVRLAVRSAQAGTPAAALDRIQIHLLP